MIRLESVSRRWAEFAIRDVTLDVAEGEYLVVVGPTGAGKTLLLELILGIHHPDSGRIILNGLAAGDVAAPDKAYLAQLVSAHTGVAPEEAARRVDQVIADAKTAEVKVQQGVDAARKAGATLTIFTALAMLIGAFIACAAAALGGQERDVHG